MLSPTLGKTAQFRALHVPGTPLVLYNVWDAGSAKTVAAAGAPAIATGSWSVAAAQGYDDGEQMPFELLLRVIERIAATVPLPLSVDIEGAYAEDPAAITANVRQVLAAGAVGVNVEDRVVRGDGLYPADVQAARLAAVRQAAREADTDLFINARTDLFFGVDEAHHEARLDEAIERARAYAAAGADGLFVPGLIKGKLIAHLVDATALPVNVMRLDGAPSVGDLAALGVARVSHGPAPYLRAQAALTAGYREVVTA